MLRAVVGVINNTSDYVSLMKARAEGTLPDMGCALRVTDLLRQTPGGFFTAAPGPSILDVGCATGHFLRTFIRQRLPLARYVGLEIDPGMVVAAREVWKREISVGTVEFVNEDLEKLAAPAAFDFVICVNAFMYFSSAKVALTNLIKATRHRLLIRSYFADANYRIVRAQTKQNHDKSQIEEIDAFDEAGNMLCYDFWNIYSQTYIEALVARIRPHAVLQWIEDKNVVASMEKERDLDLRKRGGTELLAGHEVSYPFILPWKYLSITLIDP
jgi:SAM-dependent methyltransferase